MKAFTIEYTINLKYTRHVHWLSVYEINIDLRWRFDWLLMVMKCIKNRIFYLQTVKEECLGNDNGFNFQGHYVYNYDFAEIKFHHDLIASQS